MRTGIAVSLLAVSVGGCAASAPPPAPVLSYAKADCHVQPDLASAVNLTPEKKKKAWQAVGTVGGTTPCLNRAGVNTPYVVFALPATGVARMVELGAVEEAGRLFSPNVTLLDAAGAVTREFAPDQYMFRPGVLSVQFTPREGERFMLVTADPSRVGTSYDAIRTGTATTPVVAYTPGLGVISSNYRSGHEAQVSLAYSYEGTIRASLVAPDDAK